MEARFRPVRRWIVVSLGFVFLSIRSPSGDGVGVQVTLGQEPDGVQQTAGTGPRVKAAPRGETAKPTTTTSTPPAGPPRGGEAEWIWSPAHAKDRVPAATCWFRKSFDARDVEQAFVQISCDDSYELFVNGRPAGKGDDWKLLKKFDIAKYLQPGRNCLAVKAQNKTGASAGLVARVVVRVRGGTDVSYSSNATWKTSLKEAPGWDRPRFDDSGWTPAQVYGEFGATPPWSGQVAAVDGSGAGRFLLPREFRVERVIAPEKTGSLVSLTFNEWGEILASREGGPLLLVSDNNDDGLPETVNVFCDLVQNPQGMICLNGQVFVMAEGNQGSGLYRLTDDQQDGKADQAEAIVQFEGSMAEHGPHAAALGPDGLIYCMIGNHAKLKSDLDSKGPYHHYYEGDILPTKYEDPGGHAAGIKAPGGFVLRVDANGANAQLFAGGFRNAYDLAFHRSGELFTADSDMEWDTGLPWYRPTRVNHVIAGGEYGWRSGWSPWPDYYLDSLPTTLDTGRGSPTGVECYDHFSFPVRYHNALFVCDWSQGRILAVKLQKSGATYAAKSETFLEGRPLNVTDIAIGPDGWLYFCTGGRGTEGGIYRVVWDGKAPPRPKWTGVMRAVRQPQLSAAWSRQQVASIQESLGSEWSTQIVALVENPKTALEDRLRALDLMQLVGPFPTADLAIKVSLDKQPELRAKAAWLMGLHPSERGVGRLVKMLTDSDAAVRRAVLEALARGRHETPVTPLLGVLTDASRHTRFAARRALQSLPLEAWESTVAPLESPRAFIEAACAVLPLEPDSTTRRAILERVSQLLKPPAENLSDDDFIDLLRVLELALHFGPADDDPLAQEIYATLRAQLAEEYPSKTEWRMNRELIRLLARFQESSILPRLLTELKSAAKQPEKMHAALHARFIEHGWKPADKLQWLRFLEDARALEGGHSFVGYIDNISNDFCATFTPEERRQVLAQGAKMPSAALAVLGAIAENPSPEIIASLIELDGKIANLKTPAGERLATGIVAVLASSGEENAMAHLRRQFDREPARREDLAMGLAQSPSGENWALLVRAIPVLEGQVADEVFASLAKVDESPDKPEPIRQVILAGLRARRAETEESNSRAGEAAIALLEKWTTQDPAENERDSDRKLAAWQTWFRETYPEAPLAELPQESAKAQWNYDELLGYLASSEGASGDPAKGALAFQKGQCAKCHRHGRKGETIGPDLSAVSMRFQQKEILQAILFPSQIISDQYAAKSIVTSAGKTYVGIVAPSGTDAVIVLQANGEKIAIKNADIESTTPSKKSSMPDGLLDKLTLEEIADLFAFLNSGPKVEITRQPKPVGKP